jgi:NhaA family Na+:H+ antiporter
MSRVSRLYDSFRQFARAEAASSIVLIAATIIAIAVSNSSLSDRYLSFWHHEFGLGLSIFHFVNEGLMSLFFFVVGLEIKRELVSGELSNRKTAALPLYAAIGGMIVPAAIYALTNAGLPSFSGWGIPMATDIAFVFGVVTLLGKRIPVSVRVFLLALAIVDDIGAVIVIALFYTRSIAIPAFLIALVIISVLFIGNRRGVQSLWFYSLGGLCLWLAFLYGGIHATLAGVATALLVPVSNSPQVRRSPLAIFEEMLHIPVAFVIIPLFALANAGVRFSAVSARLLDEPVSLGIVLGLVIGKPLGISLFSWTANKVGLASLPTDMRLLKLLMASTLGGIGFTMSLFIANLAFSKGELITEAKVAILCASTLSAIIGIVLFRTFSKPEVSMTK